MCEQVSVLDRIHIRVGSVQCVRCTLHALHPQYLINLGFFLVDSNLEGVAEASLSFPGVSRCCPLSHSLAFCSFMEGLPPALEGLEGNPVTLTNHATRAYSIDTLYCL